MTVIEARDLKVGQVFRTLLTRRTGWRLRHHTFREKGRRKRYPGGAEYRRIRVQFMRGRPRILQPRALVEVVAQ